MFSYSEECSNKGGVNAGSCASGFVVCCTCKKLTIFTTFFSRSGCAQWHYGSDATDYVYTFNYQTGAGVGKHLAHQRQVICVRQVLNVFYQAYCSIKCFVHYYLLLERLNVLFLCTMYCFY